MKVVQKLSLIAQTSAFTNRALFTSSKDGDFLVCAYLATSGPTTATPPGSVSIDFHVTDNYGLEFLSTGLSLSFHGTESQGQAIPVHIIAGSTITFDVAVDPSAPGTTYDLFLSVVSLPDESA